MIIWNDAEQLLEQFVRFIRVQLIDLLREWTECENALPTSDGICSNNGMNGYQFFAYILWAAARSLIDFHFAWVRCGGTSEAFT